MTKYDPLLFALVYFPHHLDLISVPPQYANMSVCDFHMDLLAWAKGWTTINRARKASRAAFIAPRQSGKSTWVFLMLPMWAAAHGHKRFVAAFSDSEAQATTHLQTFKMELATNELLKTDFPELCEGKRLGVGKKEMLNNRSQIMQANDFVFMAKGADSNSLGMKLGAVRPDVLLFDDVEPTESNYSDYEAGKRKDTLQSALLPLNEWATVGIVGTTTMPNSLIDQMRKVAFARDEYEGDPELFRESLDPEQRWVMDENINVHYWPAIMDAGTDSARSLWPERWTYESLIEDSHTRAFAKNMMNRPISADGGYWDEQDIDIDRPDYFKNTIISVDPAVTTAKRSDYTGISVISIGNDNLIYVRHAEQVKLSSEALSDRVTDLINEFEVGICVVESNQGGDLWKQVFRNIPCKFITVRATEKKEYRAGQAADLYKRGLVKHTAHFHIAEEQMLAFPHVTHDDVVDCIATGVLAMKKSVRNRVRVAQTQYMEVD